MPRPRLLVLTCHLPYPPISGGRRRELELIRRIAPDFDIHVLAVSKTPDEDRANARELRGLCRRVEIFPALPPPPRGAPAEAPRQCLRHRSPELTRRVREVLADGVDLVHVEGFFLMQHLPAASSAPILLAEQNVEHDLDLQRAQSGAGGDARAAALTWRAEVDAWRRADAIAVVTREDARLVRAAMPTATIHIVPDGADHVPLVSANPRRPRTRKHNRKGRAEAAGKVRRREQRRGRVLFVANFAYQPNADAAIHLCRDVLPLLHRARPDLGVWLVGNAPPPRVRELASESVTVTGRVDDVVPYIDRADVVVCPLRIGGGIKVKTIEGLRRGKAIVSTSIGVQGLPAHARNAILVADEPRDFAGAVTRLLRDEALRTETERRAATAGALLPTWDDAGVALGQAYDELVAPALARALEGAAG